MINYLEFKHLRLSLLIIQCANANLFVNVNQ